MAMFNFLHSLLATDDSTILFVLTLIALAMIIDFIMGAIGAFINPEVTFNSNTGINGILRKVASLILLIFFIPVSVLIPTAGTAVLYTLYFGYLLMEATSIIENYKKLGGEAKLFEKFLSNLKQKDDEEK